MCAFVGVIIIIIIVCVCVGVGYVVLVLFVCCACVRYVLLSVVVALSRLSLCWFGVIIACVCLVSVLLLW